jgi:hypothetical protein
VKYSIAVTADGVSFRRFWSAASLTLSDAGRFAWRHGWLLAALAVTVAVLAPTLRHFFHGDDFVVLGSAEHLGMGQYIADTFLMRDIVPNWRPLTGVIYAIEWEVFGLNPWAWRLVNLTVHLGSMVLLYALVLRFTRAHAAGAAAALLFGVSGAHFQTVTYITALPHVLATFFLLGSLLLLVAYTQGGERRPLLFALSFGSFVFAFLANEGSFVFAPVFVAAYALFAVRWRRAPLRLALHAAPFVALAGAWSVFYQACECAQLKFEQYYWGSHVVDNYALYLSWIAVPTKTVPLAPDTLRWLLGGAVALVLVGAAVRGPHIARLAALGVVLALLPFVPVEIWTAARYTYAAVAFFAIIVALAGYWAFTRASSLHPRLRLPAATLALAVVLTVAGLHGWQTTSQESRAGAMNERWRLLVSELQRNFDTLPAGTTIYIVEGPWSNPMEQYTWVPSVGRALYGDAAAFDLPRSEYRLNPPDISNAVFLEWTGERLQPIPPELVLSR